MTIIKSTKNSSFKVDKVVGSFIHSYNIINSIQNVVKMYPKYTHSLPKLFPYIHFLQNVTYTKISKKMWLPNMFSHKGSKVYHNPKKRCIPKS